MWNSRFHQNFNRLTHLSDAQSILEILVSLRRLYGSMLYRIIKAQRVVQSEQKSLFRGPEGHPLLQGIAESQIQGGGDKNCPQ